MDAPTAIDLARAVIGQRTPLGSGDAHDLLGEPAWVGWDADAPVVMVAISMPRRGSCAAPWLQIITPRAPIFPSTSRPAGAGAPAALDPGQ
jgi:hypothetical protein